MNKLTDKIAELKLLKELGLIEDYEIKVRVDDFRMNMEDKHIEHDIISDIKIKPKPTMEDIHLNIESEEEEEIKNCKKK